MASPRIQGGKPRSDQKRSEWNRMLCHLQKRVGQGHRPDRVKTGRARGRNKAQRRTRTWILARQAFLGNGYMPEAAEEIIRHGFENLSLGVIWCSYHGKPKIETGPRENWIPAPSYLREYPPFLCWANIGPGTRIPSKNPLDVLKESLCENRQTLKSGESFLGFAENG